MDNAEFFTECMEMLARDASHVRAVVIFGHAKPEPVERFSPFFNPTVKILKELNLPSIYVHSDGLDFDYDDGEFSRLFV